ncbi:unnamed protein product, partial [Ectocarpus sp. 13 AM-2016]
LRPAFEACRGAVRAHAPMAQFLLTHLVADVLVFGDKEAANQVLQEVLAVMCAASPPAPSSSATPTATRTPAPRSAAAETTAPAAAGATSPKQQTGSSRSATRRKGTGGSRGLLSAGFSS